MDKPTYYEKNKEHCKKTVKEYQASIANYKEKQRQYNKEYYRKGKTGAYKATAREGQAPTAAAFNTHRFTDISYGPAPPLVFSVSSDSWN